MTATAQITCINCPVGCRMEVVHEGETVLSVSGNTCKRGETYARQECVAPERVVTAVAPVQGRDIPVSLKTRAPIPKRLIDDCMRAVMERPLRRPIFTTPLFPSAPSVNDAKVWLVPASASEPPGSIVTALAAGNAPVPVSSNTAVSPMRVGPAHACGTVKRKPAPLAAAVLFGLG